MAGAVLAALAGQGLAVGLELHMPSARSSLGSCSLDAGHRAGFGLSYAMKRCSPWLESLQGILY